MCAYKTKPKKIPNKPRFCAKCRHAWSYHTLNNFYDHHRNRCSYNNYCACSGFKDMEDD